ncbi:MAG: sugar phosphate isomerase/epimerase [Planctomycetota bacterium]|nr:sugar phosphate isomerase/epimerase [Planctomycetota bacterium]
MMFPSFNARALGLKLSADETLRLASEAGFRGVDVMVRDGIEEGVDFVGLRRKMDDLGLRGGAFPFPIDWRNSNDELFRRDLNALQRVAEAAATLGLTRTGTWVMPEAPKDFVRTLKDRRACLHSRGPVERSDIQVRDESASEDQALVYGFHFDRLREIAPVLAEFGIRLGLEVIGVESSRSGEGVPYVTSLASLRRSGLVTQLVGVLIDSWHLYAANEPISHALAWGVENIIWVHVADLPAGAMTDRSAMIDSVRGLPGEHGTVESEALLKLLDLRGYEGPITAEPLAGCRSLIGLSPDAVAHAAARSLRAIWPD